MTKALLLDCFGTLVDYEPSRTAQGYEQSYLYLRELGFAGGYEAFLSTWDAMSEGFDTRAATTGIEFSMTELAVAYLAGYGLSISDDDEVDHFVDTYLGEWRTGISTIPGASALIAELHDRFRIVVVTNTHQAEFPSSVLDQFGFTGSVDAILTSVEFGRRKPDPSIYAEALRVAGVQAADALFVGDSFDADYEGPRAAGIPALLIDPSSASGVDEADRLDSILDLGSHLLTLS